MKTMVLRNTKKNVGMCEAEKVGLMGVVGYVGYEESLMEGLEEGEYG